MAKYCFCFWFFPFFAFFFNPFLQLLADQSPITIHSNQTEMRRCWYRVIMETSCSSVPYTTDQITLAFGDAYGTECVSRIDDPKRRKFERCSQYVFEIGGACMDVICYLYLMRNGSDGWKPESAKIYGPDFRTLNFHFDTFLPDGLWFGMTSCIPTSHSALNHYAFF